MSTVVHKNGMVSALAGHIFELDNGVICAFSGSSNDLSQVYKKVRNSESHDDFIDWTFDLSEDSEVTFEKKNGTIFSYKRGYVSSILAGNSHNDAYCSGDGAKYAIGASRAGSDSRTACIIAETLCGRPEAIIVSKKTDAHVVAEYVKNTESEAVEKLEPKPIKSYKSLGSSAAFSLQSQSDKKAELEGVKMAVHAYLQTVCEGSNPKMLKFLRIDGVLDVIDAAKEHNSVQEILDVIPFGGNIASFRSSMSIIERELSEIKNVSSYMIDNVTNIIFDPAIDVKYRETEDGFLCKIDDFGIVYNADDENDVIPGAIDEMMFMYDQYVVHSDEMFTLDASRLRDRIRDRMTVTSNA